MELLKHNRRRFGIMLRSVEEMAYISRRFQWTLLDLWHQTVTMLLLLLLDLLLSRDASQEDKLRRRYSRGSRCAFKSLTVLYYRTGFLATWRTWISIIMRKMHWEQTTTLSESHKQSRICCIIITLT